MTERSRSDLTSIANTNLPDNTNQAISPQDVRAMIIDVLDSYFNVNGLEAGDVPVVPSSGSKAEAAASPMSVQSGAVRFPDTGLKIGETMQLSRNSLGLIAESSVSGDKYAIPLIPISDTNGTNEQPFFENFAANGTGTQETALTNPLPSGQSLNFILRPSATGRVMSLSFRNNDVAATPNMLFEVWSDGFGGLSPVYSSAVAGLTFTIAGSASNPTVVNFADFGPFKVTANTNYFCRLTSLTEGTFFSLQGEVNASIGGQTVNEPTMTTTIQTVVNRELITELNNFDGGSVVPPHDDVGGFEFGRSYFSGTQSFTLGASTLDLHTDTIARNFFLNRISIFYAPGSATYLITLPSLSEVQVGASFGLVNFPGSASVLHIRPNLVTEDIIWKHLEFNHSRDFAIEVGAQATFTKVTDGRWAVTHTLGDVGGPIPASASDGNTFSGLPLPVAEDTIRYASQVENCENHTGATIARGTPLTRVSGNPNRVEPVSSLDGVTIDGIAAHNILGDTGAHAPMLINGYFVDYENIFGVTNAVNDPHIFPIAEGTELFWSPLHSRITTSGVAPESIGRVVNSSFYLRLSSQVITASINLDTETEIANSLNETSDVNISANITITLPDLSGSDSFLTNILVGDRFGFAIRAGAFSVTFATPTGVSLLNSLDQDQSGSFVVNGQTHDHGIVFEKTGNTTFKIIDGNGSSLLRTTFYFDYNHRIDELTHEFSNINQNGFRVPNETGAALLPGAGCLFGNDGNLGGVVLTADAAGQRFPSVMVMAGAADGQLVTVASSGKATQCLLNITGQNSDVTHVQVHPDKLRGAIVYWDRATRVITTLSGANRHAIGVTDNAKFRFETFAPTSSSLSGIDNLDRLNRTTTYTNAPTQASNTFSLFALPNTGVEEGDAFAFSITSANNRNLAILNGGGTMRNPQGNVVTQFNSNHVAGDVDRYVQATVVGNEWHITVDQAVQVDFYFSLAALAGQTITV